MEFEFQIEGLDILKKAFDLIPQNVGAKAASKAVREGAKVIQKAARANVPVDTGNLRRSIVIKVLNRKRTALNVAALIGPASGSSNKKGIQGKLKTTKLTDRGYKVGDGFYGYWVEYGTKAHFIKPKKKKVLANVKTGKVFGKGVNHPGIPHKPFMRPAYDENKVAAQQAIVDVIGEAIDAEAKKLYKGR